MDMTKSEEKKPSKVLKVIRTVFSVLRIILFVGLFVLWLIEFPICKAQAKAKYRDFSATYQSVTKDDISEMKCHKDYKLGGYIIDVVYESTPEYTYTYTYLDGEMVCAVFKENVQVVSDKSLPIPGVAGWH